MTLLTSSMAPGPPHQLVPEVGRVAQEQAPYLCRLAQRGDLDRVFSHAVLMSSDSRTGAGGFPEFVRLLHLVGPMGDFCCFGLQAGIPLESRNRVSTDPAGCPSSDSKPAALGGLSAQHGQSDKSSAGERAASKTQTGGLCVPQRHWGTAGNCKAEAAAGREGENRPSGATPRAQQGSSSQDSPGALTTQCMHWQLLSQ